MEISYAKITDRNDWDKFAAKSQDGGFLQSWEWGEAISAEGYKIWRILAKNDQVSGICLLIKYPLPFGFSYFYSPRGPIIENSKIKDQNEKLWSLLLEEVKKLARTEKAILWRLEPPHPLSNFKKLHGAKAVSPKETLILDLQKNEGALLSEMHQKTRYNINLAAKKNVIVKEGSVNNLDVFYRLLEETARRDKIKIFPKSHYENIYKILAPQEMIKLFIAEYENNPIAAIMVGYFGNFAVYLHGASSNENRNLMAPYLLQWKAIIDAKANGYESYDFYGVSSGNPKWRGITRFKSGFSPQTKFTIFPGTFELTFSRSLYFLFNLLKYIKNIIS